MSRQLAFGDSGELRPADLCDLVGVPLSPQQLEAATAPLEPGVVVAGAGSGKTTVMAARVVWLVATGQVRADEVLGLTFTNKAATSLAGRVRKALRDAHLGPGDGAGDDEPGEPTVSTYHAFAARLLAEHGLRLGVEPTSRLLADASRHQLAYRVVCRPDEPLEALDTSPTRLVGQVLGLDDALADRAVAPSVLQEHDRALISSLAAAPIQQKTGSALALVARKRIDLAGLVEQFRRTKRARDLHDFADVSRLSAELARSQPAVAGILRAQFRVVLLDEYQDTSTAQRQLLQALFGEGHPVTAVGDPCQAIYGWRGASVTNIDAFPEHFPVLRPGRPPAAARRYPLDENRRSGPAILDVANDLARRLREEHPGVGPLVPGALGKGPGVLRCAMLPTFADEVVWVADRVAALRGVVGSWREIAVLCRTGTGFGPLAAALADRGVPVEVVGAEALLGLPPVVDLVSVLRVLHDPTANPSLLRLLTGPRWRIGPRDLAVLGHRAESLVSVRRPREPGEVRGLEQELDEAVTGSDPAELVSLSDALLDLGSQEHFAYSDEARQRLTALGREIRALRRHVGDPLVDLVHRVLATTGLEVELASSPAAAAADVRGQVQAFVDLAAGFADLDGATSLGAFLRYLDDAERFGEAPGAEGPSERDAVKLLTVHKSKGLEFPVVVLPFLVADTFPTGRRQEVWTTSAEAVPFAVRDEPVPAALAGYPPADGPRAADARAFRVAWADHDLVEEIRLGYVAVTRAESMLIASGSTWTPTGTKPRLPGPFLLAVREAALGGAGQVDEWAEAPEEGATNPQHDEAARMRYAWPAPLDPEAAAARRAAADAARAQTAALDSVADGRAAAATGDDLAALLALLAATGPAAAEAPPEFEGLLAGWDSDLRLVLDQVRTDVDADVVVRLPEALSASAVMALAADEESFLAGLVRPMPRAPSPAAGRGTRFHAWVEARHGQQPMLGPDDLPGAADDGILSDDELDAMREAFLATPYAALVPAAVEAPFAVVLAGRVVRGRIDAVFQHVDPAGGPATWEVVDWKTGRAHDADPLQLALYRLAWAEQQGVPPEQVAATFVYVRDGAAVRPAGLPGRDELEQLLR
jgi:DNA helicase-2/ATP-dependent DNA helicase PcrA